MEDAPNSFRSWEYVGWEFLWANQPQRTLEVFERAGTIYGLDARLYVAAAHMADVLRSPAHADSLLARADSACPHCPTMYRNQAGAARIRCDAAAARMLLVHAERVAPPAH